MIITNLRLIWQSQRNNRTNLSKQITSEVRQDILVSSPQAQVSIRHTNVFRLPARSLQQLIRCRCVLGVCCRHRLRHNLEHQDTKRKISTQWKQVAALPPSSASPCPLRAMGARTSIRVLVTVAPSIRAGNHKLCTSS